MWRERKSPVLPQLWLDAAYKTLEYLKYKWRLSFHQLFNGFAPDPKCKTDSSCAMHMLHKCEGYKKGT